jgi:lipase chaperone LimK
MAVDKDGDLVLDEVALTSLQQAFQAVENVDGAMLEELKLYVQAGLSGETGAQAAEILEGYVRYRNSLAEAEAEWSSQQDLSPNQRLERTIALRRQYIDPVTASQLFASEDAHQRYLIAMEDIRSDTALTEPEREQALAQVREDLRRGTLLVDSSDGPIASQLRTDREHWQQLGVTDKTLRHLEQQSLGLVAARDLAGSDPHDWQRRYRQFDQEREAVLRAGLAEDEKQRQIEGLVDTYFTKPERDAAEAWLPPHLRLEAVR